MVDTSAGVRGGPPIDSRSNERVAKLDPRMKRQEAVVHRGFNSSRRKA